VTVHMAHAYRRVTPISKRPGEPDGATWDRRLARLVTRPSDAVSRVSPKYTNEIRSLVRVVYSSNAGLYLSCRWELSNLEFLECAGSNHGRQIGVIGLCSDKVLSRRLP
jgi:hypothetical protein